MHGSYQNRQIHCGKAKGMIALVPDCEDFNRVREIEADTLQEIHITTPRKMQNLAGCFLWASLNCFFSGEILRFVCIYFQFSIILETLSEKMPYPSLR